MEIVRPAVEFLTGQQQKFSSGKDAGSITVMFTDIEGSTSLTTRLGDEAAQKLLREHNETVRKALRSYNGMEIKHTGDGIMASFFSASRAVGCGLYLQHCFAKRNEINPEDAVRVRIGLNAGEPIVEDNDLYGTSVQLSRRICDRAAPGQVLVSDVVRQLLAGKGFSFQRLEGDTIKGFEDPIPLFSVNGQSAR